MPDLQAAADAALADAAPGLPGIVAVLTDRDGILYEGAAAPLGPDTVLTMHSTTKPVVAAAVLQLVEQGRLDLDAPASDILPALGTVQVIDGENDDGSFRLRPPKRAITARMLLLHTAGFAYDFCDARYARLATAAGRPRLVAGPDTLLTPLVFDPGERWQYGANIEWAGLMLEAITGQRLGDYMAEHLFAPLGMADTAFRYTDATWPRAATIHGRDASGALQPNRVDTMPPPPDWDRGGGGLYSTARDYAKFMRMWLNDGDAPGGRVLRPETVRLASQNHLGAIKVAKLVSANPALSHDAEFFPGMPKSWGLSFMINDEPAPTGRPAGALAWAGLGNLFFWIDRETGIAGFWATQLLPFMDPAAVAAFTAWETAVYQAHARRALVTHGSSGLGGEVCAVRRPNSAPN